MSSLDSNLFLQVIAIFFSILVIAIVLEGFGYVLFKLLAAILRRVEKTTSPGSDLVQRTFLGGLLYTLVFFALGELRLLSSAAKGYLY